MIVTGSGINVYPDELEAVLNRIGGVKESCVIGIDKGGGKRCMPCCSWMEAAKLLKRS